MNGYLCIGWATIIYFLNPEGLHVYRKQDAKDCIRPRPGSYFSHHFVLYKHAMPPASGFFRYFIFCLSINFWILKF